MGNFVKNQEVVQRNLDEVTQSQVQDIPNILIKQSKIGNVEIIKLNMQIIEMELIYDSVDKIQVDLTYSSQVNCSLSFYTFISEIKGSKQQRFERTMQESIIQKFKCPLGLNHQFPSRYIEFMITDLLKFNRIKATPEIQHHTLIIEMRSLTSKSLQIIYFYKIDCNEQTFLCELINTKQIIVYKNRIFEIHELYGIKNTPFNPEWNPNTIEDKECVICFCNMINTVLLPCKHMCTCSICADHIFQIKEQINQKVKQCPLCRIDIDNYLTLEIKDKVKQDLQQRQFQEEQQKYLDAIKEKKDEQAIKQSTIKEQLQSKVHQDQMQKLKLFNDIDDFQRNNQNNQGLYNNEICYSNEENISDRDNNLNQNSFHCKIKQISEEDNNLKAMQFSEDDKQRYSSNQRISSYDLKQERGIISSFQHSQEKQNDQQQPQSDESEISQEFPQFSSQKQQQCQYSFDYLNYDEQSHYNSQQQQLTNTERQLVIKQQFQFIQGNDKALPTIPEQFKESSDLFQQIINNDKDNIQKQNNFDIKQNKYFDDYSQIQSQELQKSLQQQQQQQQQQQLSHRSLIKQKNQQIQFCQLQQNNFQQEDVILNQFLQNDILNDNQKRYELQNDLPKEQLSNSLISINKQQDETVYNIQNKDVQRQKELDCILIQKNNNIEQINYEDSSSLKQIQKQEQNYPCNQELKNDQISLIVFD